jgi:phenylpropionate dioxygenase-like ring-hydroxylating dioxygenase large terminal subunit
LEIPEINDLKKTAIENHQKQHGKDAIYWFNTSSYSKLEDVVILLLFAQKNINNPEYTFFNQEEAKNTVNNLIQTLQNGDFQEFQKIIYETQNNTVDTDGKIGENTLKKTQSFLEKNLTYMLAEATVGAE